eukprot:m.165313 g.165313  ORF g.165313 m.165313 type:complete len:78 (-) comp14670_c0_seq6:3850-4083(-)
MTVLRPTGTSKMSVPTYSQSVSKSKHNNGIRRWATDNSLTVTITIKPIIPRHGGERLGRVIPKGLQQFLKHPLAFMF